MAIDASVYQAMYPSERRAVNIIYNYWNSLREGRDFPQEDDLDPSMLGDMWADCFLIQRRDIEHVQDYNYTYIGSNIIHAYEQGILHGHIEGLVSTRAGDLADLFQQVIDSRRPIVMDEEHPLDAETTLFYRQCLLPLDDGTGRVASVLGQMSFSIRRTA